MYSIIISDDRGGFRGPPGPPHPLFLYVEIFRDLYLPLCQYFGSYIDSKCVCVCMRSCACVCACMRVCVLLLKCNLTILELISTPSYSPSTWALCTKRAFWPLYPKIRRHTYLQLLTLCQS